LLFGIKTARRRRLRPRRGEPIGEQMRLSRLAVVAVSTAMLAAIGFAGVQINRSATRSAIVAHRTDGAVRAGYASSIVADRMQAIVNSLAKYGLDHGLTFRKSDLRDAALLANLTRTSKLFNQGVLAYASTGEVVNGTELSRLAPDADPGYVPLMQAILSSTLPVSGVLSTADPPQIAFAGAVLQVGRPTGMLVGFGTLTGDPLHMLLAGLVDPTAALCLFDSAGRVVTSTGQWPVAAVVPADFAAAGRAGRTQAATFDTTTDGRKSIGFAVGGIPGGWTLAVTLPEDTYDADINRRGLRVNLALLAVLVFAIAIVVITNLHAESKLRRSAELLQAQATMDSLTSLPNRRLLYERLDAAIGASDTTHPVAVLYLDLDRFKPVNDEYGHEAGDELLRLVAERIGTQLRPHDTLARVGGDEFVLVASGVSSVEAGELGARIVAALSEPFALASAGGARVRIGASVGLDFARTADRPDDVLRRADGAMYRAKRSGGRQVSAGDPVAH
jgi:diguanylate cyclase (GGDEF)-like protein